MKFSPDLEAKLSTLSPQDRANVEGAGRKLAKASMRKMLDQTPANHQKRQAQKQPPAENEPVSAWDRGAPPKSDGGSS